MHLLIIDDDVDHAESLQAVLRGAKHTVALAHTGVDGLALFKTMKFDAVLLDLMMPDMNGWEFLEKVNSVPEARGVPIIVVSGYDEIHPEANPEEMRRLEIIHKPYEVPQLLECIDRCFASGDHGGSNIT